MAVRLSLFVVFGKKPSAPRLGVFSNAPKSIAGVTLQRSHRLEIALRLRSEKERVVVLASGETVRADDDYLRESILDPARKLSAGYAPLMPRYSELSRREVDGLVEAIRRLPASPAETAQPSGGAAEDPVCHMKVSTVDPRLTLNLDGKTHHFCSRSCLDSFVSKK